MRLNLTLKDIEGGMMMESNVEKIRELVEQRKYKAARNEIYKIKHDKLAANDTAVLLCLSGICSYELDGFDVAERKFLQCLSYCKKHEISHYYHPFYELSLLYLQKYTSSSKSTYIDKSIFYCHQALEIALNYSVVEKNMGLMQYYEDSPEAYIQVAIQLGVLHQIKGDYQKSIEVLLLCKSACKSMYNLFLLGQVYDELGTSYILSGNQVIGFYYYNKSLIAKQKCNNKHGIKITLGHLFMLCRKELGTVQYRKIIELCNKEQV